MPEAEKEEEEEEKEEKEADKDCSLGLEAGGAGGEGIRKQEDSPDLPDGSLDEGSIPARARDQDDSFRRSRRKSRRRSGNWRTKRSHGDKESWLPSGG